MTRAILPYDECAIAAAAREAKRAVLYSAPGLTRVIATALVDVAVSLGPDRVGVVIDPAPEVIRLGYGELQALQLLQARGLTVHSAPGLRSGFVRIDDTALAFAPLSRLLEDEGPGHNLLNAFRIGIADANRLTRAILPALLTAFDAATALSPGGCSEISGGSITDQEMCHVEQSLRANPPVAPDLARKLRVLNSRLQFVEISFKGCKLSQHRFSLKPEDIGVDLRLAGDNLAGTWKVIGANLEAHTKALENDLKQIRDIHLVPLSGFGQVILGENRPMFDKAMEAFRKNVQRRRQQMRDDVKAELSRSRERLKTILVASYATRPPNGPGSVHLDDDLRHKQAVNRAESALSKRYPDADKLIGKMDVDWKIFNVSEQIISKPGFAKAVRERFHVDLEDLVKSEQAIGLRPWMKSWDTGD